MTVHLYWLDMISCSICMLHWEMQVLGTSSSEPEETNSYWCGASEPPSMHRASESPVLACIGLSVIERTVSMWANPMGTLSSWSCLSKIRIAWEKKKKKVMIFRNLYIWVWSSHHLCQPRKLFFPSFIWGVVFSFLGYHSVSIL